MKQIILEKKPHIIKIGDSCGRKIPNVTEDSLFIEDGKIIGFYIASMKKYSQTLSDLASLANAELLSDRVPKSTMTRLRRGKDGKEDVRIQQYSTILGGVPPKPHMRRNYMTMSSVHAVPSAQKFVKAMLLLCRHAEDLIAQIAPEIFDTQCRIISEHVEEQWRFGRMFTSSISNFNIAADYHIDAANIPHCVNIIIAKKRDAEGGHTNVPDYDATVNSCDDSMLVYPAWRNVHGVSPIELRNAKGYRNSLVFYPLKAFLKKEE